MKICWKCNFTQFTTWICWFLFIKEVSLMFNLVVYSVNHRLNKLKELIWTNFLYPNFICERLKLWIYRNEDILKRTARFNWNEKVLVLLFIHKLVWSMKCSNLMSKQSIRPSIWIDLNVKDVLFPLNLIISILSSCVSDDYWKYNIVYKVFDD